VVAVLGTDVEAASVERAASGVYERRGSEALEIPLLEMVQVAVGADVAHIRCVVAVAERIVEIVVDEGPFEALGPSVWALAARGWEVVVLSPAGRTGEGHRALRGTPCLLQPWWIEDEGVRFGRHETP
jgi:hypothetical protein